MSSTPATPGAGPVPSGLRLRREQSVLLVIDLQERLMPVIAESEALVERTRRLIVAARRLAVPVFLTEQVPEKLGATVAVIREAFGDSAALAKVTFSACPTADPAAPLPAALFHAARPQIVLTGVETHVCVLQTGLDLIAAGYRVFAAEDAVGSRDPRHKANALQRLTLAGAVPVNHESVLFEWLDSATDPAFRELSRLVK